MQHIVRRWATAHFFIYRNKDPQLPYTRFAKPKFSYAESLNFEQERQKREFFVLNKVKEKLLEAADRNCRQRAKHCKDKTLKVDDRVFLRRQQKKGESKLVARWQGPYRILTQVSPNVYKMKCLKTAKVTTQHIENLKEKVLVARESEIPLSQCPQARLPFPEEADMEDKEVIRRVPEGEVGDDSEDASFYLEEAKKLKNKKNIKVRRSPRLNRG